MRVRLKAMGQGERHTVYKHMYIRTIHIRTQNNTHALCIYTRSHTYAHTVVHARDAHTGTHMHLYNTGEGKGECKCYMQG